MVLILIGTGISFDLTLSAINALRQCDEVYIEHYTNLIEEEKIRSLEKLIAKKIRIIERKDVESDFLIKQAANATIALLCSGDPLIATTHVALLIDAKNKKIETKVIHNSSIYTVAAGRAGLQIYRFGKTATLVNPRPNYKPTSSLDIIRENLARNLHTLVLLDTEPHFMDGKDALEILKEFEYAIVLSRLGEKDEYVTYGKISELKDKKLGKPPFTLIIPAKLHPVEAEYINLF